MMRFGGGGHLRAKCHYYRSRSEGHKYHHVGCYFHCWFPLAYTSYQPIQYRTFIDALNEGLVPPEEKGLLIPLMTVCHYWNIVAFHCSCLINECCAMLFTSHIIFFSEQSRNSSLMEMGGMIIHMTNCPS